MPTLARLLILLGPLLTGCEALRGHVHDRAPPAEAAPARRPLVDALLHGRPSLPEERAADQPRADAYRSKKLRFYESGGYPWQWAP
jgi:hypothetical protein